MCGRYFLNDPMEAIAGQFGAEPLTTFPACYNLAPGAAVPVLIATPDGRIITLHQWGLVPSWSKDPTVGARMANARAETVADKPSFRGPFRRSRCIIPASGFYEWQARPGGAKQPYCIRAADGAVLALAGLRSRWEGPDGCLDTCTIVTTTANAVLAPIHDRMPVILAVQDQAAWLDPDTSPARLKALLRPCPEGLLRVHAVDRRVGNAVNDDPALVEPVDA